jgi:transposase
MTDHSNDTPELSLVAIDVAKQWNVVLVKDCSGCKRSFKVANTAADHEQLIRFLMALPGQVRIALEPTGDYHRPLAFRLLQTGFQVVSVSSVAQARFREARYGTWDKNDPKDARVILAMLEHGLVQTYYDPLFEGTHDLQELSNTYYQVTLARTRLQHSLLTHHLPLYFPEFARYWYSTRSEWLSGSSYGFRFHPLSASCRGIDSFRKPGNWLEGNARSRRSWRRFTDWHLFPSGCPWRSIRRRLRRFGSSCSATKN